MPTIPNGSPSVNVYELNSPGQATAANDSTFVLDKVKRAGSVSLVTYTPAADITGQNTNTRKFDLINKGQDGNGTTVIASLQFNSGINATDFDEKAITLGVAANLVVAAGDVLAWFSDAILTGIADPGGLVKVEVTANTHSTAGLVRGFPAV